MTHQPRTAIVTGGMSGIGLCVVQQLLADGLRVCVGARRASDAALATEFQIATGARVDLLPLDVTQTDSVQAFVSAVQDAAGPPDILVNAAGLYGEAGVIDHPDDLWDDMIATNLSGCFRMIRAVMPGMVAARWGRIVNIASVAAHHGMAGNAAYCASKSGLLGLGRCVSLEGAAHGVTCTSISPTWVETQMLLRYVDDEVRDTGKSRAEVLAKYQSSNPQGALVQPQEVARLVSYLISDAGRAITMEDIQINAGAMW